MQRNFTWFCLLWCAALTNPQLAPAQVATSAEALTDEQRRFVEEHLPLGLPGDGPWVIRAGYVLSYNNKLRFPNWVAYRLTRDSPKLLAEDDPNSLRLDPDVEAPAPDAAWPENGDYLPTRLAPLEVMRRDDANLQAKLEQQANSMGNIVYLDERGLRGLWSELQWWMQEELVAETQTDVWVIAGCLAGRRDRVPPAVYAIVYLPRGPDAVETLAFLLPHQDDFRGQISNYIVPLEVLEDLSGVNFFPQVARRLEWEQLTPGFGMAAAMAEPGFDPADSPEAMMEDASPADSFDGPRKAKSIGPAKGARAGGSDTAGSDAKDAGKAPYQVVPVFYGTDRQVDASLLTTGKITKREDIPRYYGGTEDPAGTLHLGICRVSVPTDREIASIPLAGAGETPVRGTHFVLTELEPLTREAFLTQINEEINRFAGQKQVVVYVHGFDNTFADAAHRSAQLVVDLKAVAETDQDVEFLAAMYTWPSQGSPLKYPKDGEQAKRSIPRMQEFLRLIAQETDAETIHLIAHSMGTWLLTNALAQLPEGDGGDLPHLNQIILAAPDIDAGTFVNKIAPRIERFGERITIYQSNRDQALFASQFANKELIVPRLGLRPVDLRTVDDQQKFNQVDATWIADSDFGHTYFGNVSKVIGDVRDVLDGRDVESRDMLPSYIMRGKVQPWKQAERPSLPFLAWWQLAVGFLIGAVLVRLFWRRKAKA